MTMADCQNTLTIYYSLSENFSFPSELTIF